MAIPQAPTTLYIITSPRCVRYHALLRLGVETKRNSVENGMEIPSSCQELDEDSLDAPMISLSPLEFREKALLELLEPGVVIARSDAVPFSV